MADNKREVSLEVAVSTTGTEGVRKLATDLQTLAQSGGQAAPEFQRLADELSKIADQGDAVLRLSALRDETQALGAEQNAAAEKARLFGSELKTASAGVATLAEAEERARVNVAAAARALDEKKEAVKLHAAETTTAAKKTDEYQLAHSALQVAVVRAGTALREQRDALKSAEDATATAEAAEKKLGSAYTAAARELDQANAALKKRADALKADEQALEAAGIATADLGAAQEKLRAALLSTSEAAQTVQREHRALAQSAEIAEAAERELAASAKAAGDALAGAFDAAGLRSASTIRAEIAGVNDALLALSRNARVSGEDFDRAFASGQRRIADLNDELQKTPKHAAGTNIAVTAIRNSFAELAAVYGGIELGQKFFEANFQIETLRRSLTLIVGSSEGAAAQIKLLKDVANNSGQAFSGLTQDFTNFIAATTTSGISLESARETFANVTQAAGTLGISTDRVGLILGALGQIASKGQVSLEELRGQLGESLPGAMAIAARGMGVTQARLVQLVETGQVMASEFFPAFNKGLTETFGGAATRVEGVQAAFNRAKNALTELSQQASDSAAFRALAATLDFVAANMGTLATGAFKLGEAFVALKVAGAAGDLLGFGRAANIAKLEVQAKTTALAADTVVTQAHATASAAGAAAAEANAVAQRANATAVAEAAIAKRGAAGATGADTIAAEVNAVAAEANAVAQRANATAVGQAAAARGVATIETRAATIATNADTIATEANAVAHKAGALAFGTMASTLPGVGTAFASVGSGAALAATGVANTAAQAGLGARALGALGQAGGAALGLIGGLPGALLLTALNAKDLGVALGEGVAKLFGYGNQLDQNEKKLKEQDAALKAAGESSKKLADEHAAAEKKALGLTDASSKLVDEFGKLTLKGETTADSLKKISANFDFTNTKGISDAITALDALERQAKITGTQAKAALSLALKDDDLLKFETAARSALDGTEAGARKLQIALGAIDGESLRRAGTSAEELKTGFSAAATSAINDLDRLSGALTRTGADSETAGRLLGKSLDKAVEVASTQKALDALAERAKTLFDAGQISSKQYEDELEKIRLKSLELNPTLEGLGRASKALGIDFNELTTGVSVGFKQSTDAVQSLVRGVVDTGVSAQRASPVLEKALNQQIAAAKTKEELELVKRAIDAAVASGKLFGTDAAAAIETYRKKAAELSPALRQAQADADRLGITLRDKVAEGANGGVEGALIAYERLKGSGKASAGEIGQAFVSAANEAIRANSGIVPEWVKVEAATRGAVILVNEFGVACVEMGFVAGKSFNAAAIGIESATAALQRNAAAAKQAKEFAEAFDPAVRNAKVDAEVDAATKARQNLNRTAIDNTTSFKLKEKNVNGTLTEADLPAAKAFFEAAKNNLATAQQNQGSFSFVGFQDMQNDFNAARAILEKLNGKSSANNSGVNPEVAARLKAQEDELAAKFKPGQATVDPQKAKDDAILAAAKAKKDEEARQKALEEAQIALGYKPAPIGSTPKPPSAASSTHTVNVTINGKPTTVNVASAADGDALTSMLKQLGQSARAAGATS